MKTNEKSKSTNETNVSVIVICGGGGKTTLSKKYPNKLIDIDQFIWSEHNTKHHKLLEKYCAECNNEKIGELYKQIITSNKNYLKSTGKIILMHHPINAEWLDTKYEMILKPSKELHLENIKNRPKNLQQIAINNWNMLDNAVIYKTNEELEGIIKGYFTGIKRKT